MKKIILISFLLLSIKNFGQSSRFRVENNTKFGWSQKFVPVKQYSDSTWDAVLFKQDLPDFGNGYWSLAGNTLTNTTSFLGTLNNTSLKFKTNNSSTDYFKYDSIGNLVWKHSQGFGFNNALFQVSDLINSGFGVFVPTIYLGVKQPTAYNWFAWSDSLIQRINGPQTIQLCASNIAWLTASPANPGINGNRYISFTGINSSTATLTSNKTHIFIGGCTWGYTGSPTITPVKIAIVADTHSATVATTLGLAITLDVPKPIAGSGITFTAPLSARFTGNVNMNGQLYLGGAVNTPSAQLNLAAGNATLPAIKFTSQTAVSAPNAGEMFYNSVTGFNWQGNQNISGNEIVVGTFSAGAGVTTPTVFGGSAASGTLVLGSTSNATRGSINFGTGMTFDQVNKTLTIGNIVTGTHTLEVNGNANITQTLSLTGYTTNAVAAAVVTTTATLNFPSTNSNASSSLTVSIPSGALDTDGVVVGVPISTRGADLGTWSGGVTAANVVTVIYHNTGGSAYDPPSGTFKIYVFKN